MQQVENLAVVHAAAQPAQHPGMTNAAAAAAEPEHMALPSSGASLHYADHLFGLQTGKGYRYKDVCTLRPGLSDRSTTCLTAAAFIPWRFVSALRS